LLFYTGGGGPSTGEPLQSHDFIDVLFKTNARIYNICTQLYDKGLSLREIEAQTGIAKSTIRGTLNKKGYTLRNYETGKNLPKDRTKIKKPGLAPYGFAYLDGKMVLDPKEHLVVRKILNLWQSTKSVSAIATKLNDQKIPTRRQAKWRACVVKSIINCHLKLNKTNGGK